MNTANKLTLLRLILTFLMLIVLYIGFVGSNYVAMGIFIVAGITDFVDGYIARKRGQITDFGKFVDPLADKILVFSAMLWFVGQGIVPSWAAILVLTREFMVTGLRLIAVANRRVMAAALSGKVKTVVSIICISALFLPVQPWIVYLCIFAITTTTVFSGVSYFVQNRDILKMDLK